jgi:RNA polymerase sigma-70 factor (ECF subfamily)
LDNNDSEIILRAINGDQEAYSKLLRKYKGAIYSMIYKMVRNKQDTEDLVQEAFIKAFSSLTSFNDEYAFSTWLFKIATNNCIDYLRKKKLKTLSIDKPLDSEEGDLFIELADKQENPENGLLDREKKSKIDIAIDSLPPIYRYTIILRHKEDKSYEEISQILNIPIGTVKARIFRAREMLKIALKEMNFLK